MSIVSLDFSLSQAVRSTVPRAPSQRTDAAMARPRIVGFPAVTDFGRLRGSRLLCLVDEDNLRISSSANGYRLSYALLLGRLRETCASVSGWAVLTAEQGDERRESYLQHRGWRTLTIPRETILSPKGLVRKANADMDLCFAAGYLLRASPCDGVLLGSGDGDLCVAIARGIKRCRPALSIFTLSIPGSTSLRLSTRADLFDRAILVGRDLTH